jgi:hypothetical protein
MKVTQPDGKGGYRYDWDDFTIADHVLYKGRWQYQLNDDKGALYDKGKWFAEGALESR